MATQAAREALAQSRKDALGIAGDVGVEHVQGVLKKAAAELEKRLAVALAQTKGEETFTVAHMRAALEQLQELLAKLVLPGVKSAVMASGMKAADASATNAIEYLGQAHYAFEGMKAQPLAVNEAFMFDAAKNGARASILRRLALSGEAEGIDADPHKAKGGILARYGLNVIEHFEQTMQQGVLMKQPIEKMRSSLIEKSPFLQAAPRYWAERIVRTETMNAYNRSGWEAMREADNQLGDMCKILSATFDNRTAADSYAVHGQIRRMDEAFETWYGLMQHPPARPNDREVVVPHRISWPIPKYLAPKTDAEVAERWAFEGRKGSPPRRPKLTTIAYSEFGKPQPLTDDEKGGEEKQGPLEPAETLGYELGAEDAAAKAAFELPERQTYSPEEKAAYATNMAHRGLAAMPEQNGSAVHDFDSYDKYADGKWAAPYLEGFTPEEQQIVKDAVFGDYMSLLSDMNVEIDNVILDSPAIGKKLISASIDKGGEDTEIPPEITKHDGKWYVTIGSEDVLASSLLGKTHIKAKVLDLENPGVRVFIKAKAEEAAKKKAEEEAAKKKAEEEAAKLEAALAEKKAKNAIKAAKAAATKAANKAKKLAAEEQAALPAIDVSAKPVDPDNILHRKYGEQKGSNDGGFYEGADGFKRYVKDYTGSGYNKRSEADARAQAHGEQISNAVYRALGFDAPESEVFVKDGHVHHAAKLFEGQTLGAMGGGTKEHAKQLLDGFAADVLLANWDVVGMGDDNIFVQPNGKLARIDNGGSLLMRAKAGRKDKSQLFDLTEVENFFNGKNESYKKLAAKAGVTGVDDLQEQLLKGVKQITALRDQHGGWDAFVSKVAPDFKGEDRAAVVAMLEARANKLVDLTKPKPKPVVQETEKGKYAPPKIKYANLTKVSKEHAPKQTKNETPDGRPLYEYRAHIEREIAKAPRASREAINQFTGSSYTEMREAYSKGDKTSYTGRAAHQIPEAFDNVKPVPGEVYRCIGVSREIGQAYCDLDEDELIHLGPWGGGPAYASASRTQRVSIDGFSRRGQQPILFVMNHKRGIGIESISGIKGENEVLMHPNAHFKVTKRYRADIDNRDFLVLHLDEVDEPEIEAHYTRKGRPVPTVKRLDK